MGAEPIVPPIKGYDEANNVFTLRNIPDLDAIMDNLENKNPKDYFEYVVEPNILSMSFEGGLNYLLNGYMMCGCKLLNQFTNIFNKYECYYELGDSWNLTIAEL